jgi:hypothetical protein
MRDPVGQRPEIAYQTGWTSATPMTTPMLVVPPQVGSERLESRCAARLLTQV